MTYFTSGLYGQNSLPEHSRADSFACLPLNPSKDIVLCRDENGQPTAIYGNSTWDLTPYHLIPGRSGKIHFDRVPLGADCNPALIEEVKRIIFFLIYCSSEKGMSVTTLLKYAGFVRKFLAFCKSFEGNHLVGELSIEMLITNITYLRRFVEKYEKFSGFKKLLGALLVNAQKFPKGTFKLPVVKLKDLKVASLPHNQHCVIPSRIYILIMESLSQELDHLHNNMKNLDKYITALGDRSFGVSWKVQEEVYGLKEQFRPTFHESLKQFGLEKLFVGSYYAKDRRGICRALGRMQFLVKHVIHLYSGMRDQEVMRLRYDCIMKKEVTPNYLDEVGNVREPARTINIISTTTKFTRYLKPEAWIATEEVERAIEVAQTICRGLVSVIPHSDEEKNPYLFIGVSVLTAKNHGLETIVQFRKRVLPVIPSDEWKITVKDREELLVSDPSRNLETGRNFSVGEVWPLSSHQYRRSLAFYASSTGFVSQPTLKKQFKHTSLLMTQYYSNNFENFKKIFGYFDDSSNESVVAGSHLAYEFQLGMSEHAANKIVSYVSEENMALHGGAGIRLEKQRDEVLKDLVSVTELRSATIRAVKNGELAYRETLLGGCTKFGSCENLMLGSVTSCVSCESAIIHESKLMDVTLLLQHELSQYADGSVERKLCLAEIGRLTSLREKFK